ncbi:MAG: MBL fold metallo-hydrolase [Candidatus Limnocylindrales bacterium]
MRLTVIGPGPAYTRRPRTSSCYLVEAGAAALVLDLGHGSFTGLARRRDPASLTAIFVSHLHPDHHIDLVPLRHFLMYAPHAPGRVALHAPADLRRRYDELNGEAGFLDVLEARPDLAPGTRQVGPFRIDVGRVTHTDSSFGFRIAIDDGDAPGTARGLVYSGDCGRPGDLLALLRPGDVLLSEASFGGAEPVDQVEHLTAAEAGRAAREGAASRLILTHILDEAAKGALPAARSVYSGPVELARPGLQVDIA